MKSSFILRYNTRVLLKNCFYEVSSYMKLSHKLVMVSAAALMGISPIVSAGQNTIAQAATKKAVKKTAAKKTSKKSTKKAAGDTIVLGKKSYVYDENGKRNKKYKYNGETLAAIGKGAKLQAYGTKTINGKKYYFLGNNSYIRTVNVATVNGKKVAKKTTKKATNKVNTKSIKLTHNAYVYDKNGKRIKKAVTLKKNQVIAYFSVKKIKGKNYYYLGQGRYVKTANAKKNTKSSSDVEDNATWITLVNNSIVYDENGMAFEPEIKFSKGVSYQALSAKKIDEKWYYEVGTMDGKTQWIKAVNAYVSSGKALINDPDFVEPKPNQSSNDTIVTLKNNTDTYDSKGKIIPNNTFGPGYSLRVSRLLWIWIPSENKAEQFYKIASDSSSYIKAADVATISGTNLTSENSEQDAKDAVTVATATDKAALQTAIQQENEVKNGPAYQASTADQRNAYSDAVAKGQTVLSSNTATVLDVKNALAAINKAISNFTQPSQPTTTPDTSANNANNTATDNSQVVSAGQN